MKLLSQAMLASLAFSVSLTAFAWPPFMPGVNPGFYYPMAQSAYQSLRLEPGQDQQGYYLRIYSGQYQPEDLVVKIHSRWLEVSLNKAQQQHDQFGNQFGQTQHFSWQSSGLTQRLSLPADADPSQITQEIVDDQQLLLRIPRSQ